MIIQRTEINNPRFQMELSVSNGTVLATRVIYMFLLRDTHKNSCFLAWHAKNYILKLVESCVLRKFLIRKFSEVFANRANIFFVLRENWNQLVRGTIKL